MKMIKSIVYGKIEEEEEEEENIYITRIQYTKSATFQWIRCYPTNAFIMMYTYTIEHARKVYVVYNMEK